MTLDERRKYLQLIKKRYPKASKYERGCLLDEMKAITGLHRKSLIRLMLGRLERKVRHKQRGSTYGPEVDDALRLISESFDHVCTERLQPDVVWMTTHLAQHGELEASPRLLYQLSHISLNTVRCILSRIRQDEPRLPRKGPAQANRVARDVEKTTGRLPCVQGRRSQIKPRFDQGRIPFDRLCESDAISQEQKARLGTLRDQGKPRHLRQQIHQLIDHIFLLPGAVPEETEGVFETLPTPTESQKGVGIPLILSFERTASLR